MSRRPDTHTVSNPLYLSCIFVFVLSPAALGLEKPWPKKAKACVQNMQLDGWLVGDSAKWPHSLFDIFPIVCLMYFRIWTLISILVMFLRVFGKRRREREEENKHNLDFLDWKSCEGRQIPVPYCASSLWARSNTSLLSVLGFHVLILFSSTSHFSSCNDFWNGGSRHWILISCCDFRYTCPWAEMCGHYGVYADWKLPRRSAAWEKKYLKVQFCCMTFKTP